MPDISIGGRSSSSVSMVQSTRAAAAEAMTQASNDLSQKYNVKTHKRETTSRYGHYVPFRIDRRMGALLDVNVWLDSNDWVLVKSSNISAIRYNREMRILSVIFLNGTRYEYDMVPEQTAVAFFSAKSLGKFLHARIKGKFTFRGPLPANIRTIQTIRFSTAVAQQQATQ